jgi:hypothetical protein
MVSWLDETISNEKDSFVAQKTASVIVVRCYGTVVKGKHSDILGEFEIGCSIVISTF